MEEGEQRAGEHHSWMHNHVPHLSITRQLPQQEEMSSLPSTASPLAALQTHPGWGKPSWKNSWTPWPTGCRLWTFLWGDQGWLRTMHRCWAPKKGQGIFKNLQTILAKSCSFLFHTWGTILFMRIWVNCPPHHLWHRISKLPEINKEQASHLKDSQI